MMKTCPYCKFEIPADALVCGHCRKNQPSASVPQTPEQIQSERTAKRRCLIFAGAVVVLFSVVALVESISDSNEKAKISAKVDRLLTIEQQSSTKAAKALLPGISRYADLLEGNLQISNADRRKEVESLRGLAEITHKQAATIEALDLGDPSTPRAWRKLSAMFITDAQPRGAVSSRMKPSERSASAQLHRKLAVVLQKHTSEGFVNCASLETDLYGFGVLRKERQKDVPTHLSGIQCKRAGPLL